MEIILLENVNKVGGRHEIVTVKNGYGRNYLIPQKLAVIANETNRKKLNQMIRVAAAQELKMVDAYKEIVGKLNGEIIKIGAKAGTSGKIFGSVTNIQISQAIKEQQGIEIDRKKITLPEEVKNLGVYTAEVALHPEVDCKVTFEVISE